MLLASVFALSGIRAYLSFFINVATLVYCAHWWPPHAVHAAASAILLPMTWLVIAAGGGSYYEYYEKIVKDAILAPTTPVSAARSRPPLVRGDRRKYVDGNGTDGHFRCFVSETDRRNQVFRGLAALIVPITVLQALSIVECSGGQGLLFITDIDTLIADFALI